jgi:hypothetical protein
MRTLCFLGLNYDSPVSIFSVAHTIDTPLMLAGLVVLVISVLFKAKLSSLQTKLLFVLALISIVLGTGSYILPSFVKPPSQWGSVYGTVFSPPDKNPEWVPSARVVLFLGQNPPIEARTNGYGYFQFSVSPADVGKHAKIFVEADGYRSFEKDFEATSTTGSLEIGLVATTAQSQLTPKPNMLTPPATHEATGAAPKASATNVEPSHASAAKPKQEAGDSCLNGTWYMYSNLEPNKEKNLQAGWSVSVIADTLTGRLNNSIAMFSLQKSDSAWNGVLDWGDGNVWHNFIIETRDDCSKIVTNKGYFFIH